MGVSNPTPSLRHGDDPELVALLDHIAAFIGREHGRGFRADPELYAFCDRYGLDLTADAPDDVGT